MPTAQPSPTPTGSYTQPYTNPQPAPTPSYNTGVTDWNKQWNDIWNQAWNAGYNRGTKPSVDPSFSSAVDQGYSAGYSKYTQQNPSPTPQVLGSSTSSGTDTGGTGEVVPQIDWGAVNAIYQPNADYLNQVESTISSQQPGVEQSIMSNYGLSKSSLEGERTLGENKLAKQTSEAGQGKEDAQSAAVRLFNELKRGGIQRFGGASSAGEAFGELTGNELQRNMGGIQKAWSVAVDKINGYKADLQQKFTTAIATLEQQKNDAIMEAKNYFQERMLEVQKMKAENESAKAAANLSLLQDYRNKIFTINMQDLQYKQQLALNKQAGEQQASDYLTQLQEQLSMGQNATTTGINNMQANTGTTLGINSQNKTQQQTPTGQVASTKKNWWEV